MAAAVKWQRRWWLVLQTLSQTQGRKQNRQGQLSTFTGVSHRRWSCKRPQRRRDHIFALDMTLYLSFSDPMTAMESAPRPQAPAPVRRPPIRPLGPRPPPGAPMPGHGARSLILCSCCASSSRLMVSCISLARRRESRMNTVFSGLQASRSSSSSSNGSCRCHRVFRHTSRQCRRPSRHGGCRRLGPRLGTVGTDPHHPGRHNRAVCSLRRRSKAGVSGGRVQAAGAATAGTAAGAAEGGAEAAAEEGTRALSMALSPIAQCNVPPKCLLEAVVPGQRRCG